MRVLCGLCVALFTLGACTPVGYFKAGMTDADFQRDREECAELARREAFHDYASGRLRFSQRHRSFDRHGDFSTFDDPHFSLWELEWDYRRLCMLSRGYELVPLEEDEGADGEPEAE